MAVRRPQSGPPPAPKNYRAAAFKNAQSDHGWYHCAYCGRPIRKKDADVDHMIPRALGGTNDASNLCIACQRCNRQKGKMDPEEYGIYQELRDADEEEAFMRDEEKYGEDGAMERLARKWLRDHQP